MFYQRFVQRLASSSSDLSNLMKIRPFRGSVNFNPADNLSAGLIRIEKEERGANHTYAVWFQKLRVAMRREADNFAKGESSWWHRHTNQEQTNSAGEVFERELADRRPDPLQELLLREEADRQEQKMKVVLACLHKEVLGCGCIPLGFREKVEAIFVVYFKGDDSVSMNSIRKAIAPEISRQRLSEYWKVVRCELIKAYRELM